MSMPLSRDDYFEILSWLPAKAIHRLKSSCKLFSEITNDTYFAMKQAQNSLSKDDTCFFIQHGIFGWYNNCCIELHPLPWEELSSGIPRDATSTVTTIIASSNGLILGREELFISNPVTGSYEPIPAPMPQNYDHNMVMHCNASDFMVCVFYDAYDWSSYFACKVYSEKEGVWRTKEGNFFAGERRLRFELPVHYNGALHLISDCFPYLDKKSPYFRPYILSYSYEAKFLRVPKGVKRGSHDTSCDIGIFKWGKVNSSSESICLVRLRKKVFDVWVLTNYESSSWRRILKVRVAGMGLSEQKPLVTGFTVLNGDILVVATRKRVYSYGLTNERYMVLEEICEPPVNIISYSNTLRSYLSDFCCYQSSQQRMYCNHTQLGITSFNTYGRRRKTT